MTGKRQIIIVIVTIAASSARAICPYDANCINNPYSGRNPVAPQGGVVAAPFGRYSGNQLNPDFAANPLPFGGISNPFAPAPKINGESGTLAPPFSGLRSGVRGSNGELQGVDPDLRK